MSQPSATSMTGKGVFPHKYAFTLLLPFRNFIFSPKKLLRRLALADDHVVLEIGPGPGYFSTHVAKTLSRGRLDLLDIQPEMLAKARRRLAQRGLTNVTYQVTDGSDLALAPATYDRIFMVTVLGEVSNPDLYLRAIHDSLKADGILSITELAGDPDKLTMEQLIELVSPYGFAVSEQFGSRLNYTVNLKKVGEPRR